MSEPDGITMRIGNFDEVEAEKLERWRSMSNQERLDAYAELLKLWWGDRESTLKRTYRLTTIPRR